MLRILKSDIFCFRSYSGKRDETTREYERAMSVLKQKCIFIDILFDVYAISIFIKHQSFEIRREFD